MQQNKRGGGGFMNTVYIAVAMERRACHMWRYYGQLYSCMADWLQSQDNCSSAVVTIIMEGVLRIALPFTSEYNCSITSTPSPPGLLSHLLVPRTAVITTTEQFIVQLVPGTGSGVTYWLEALGQNNYIKGTIPHFEFTAEFIIIKVLTKIAIKHKTMMKCEVKSNFITKLSV